MSKQEAQLCKNGCGGYIYFDKDSEIGHPEPDKWYPLEYNKEAGIKTNQRHQCPNRKQTNGINGSSSNGSSIAKTETSETIISLLKDIDGKLNRLLAIEGQ
jgi:hypothetical protein